MKQENHETRSFSRVFNVCKLCLRMNVRFFYSFFYILIAVVAKNLGSKKTGTINSARDERSEVSARTSFRKP